MHQSSNEDEYPPRRQKVAIPRLDPQPPPPPKARESRIREERVGRACKNCRKRKVRCSGDVPTCKNCESNNVACVYEQARRDRLREASNLNHTLVSLLRDLQDRVNQMDQQRIEDVLKTAEQDIMSPITLPGQKGGRKERQEDDRQNDTNHGEAYVTASVGSNENLDHLDEDLMRTEESRQTGYIGQNSEVQWLRSVQRQTKHTGAEPHVQRFGPPGANQDAISARASAMRERRDTARDDARQGSMRHVIDSSFYLDDASIDVDIVVDPHELPSSDIAEKLFNCYMKTVHQAFPLVPNNFEDQFRRYISSVRNNGPFVVPDKWRAQMNLLFAIGAKYSHLTNAPWQGDERDHLVYMKRAVHLLGLKNTIMIISGPDLELVQATGTLAFYFLIIGQVSRAWIMIGFSLRLGLSLGLHLRNEDPGAEESRKSTLAQAWWSLHSIECLVSVVTGRPPVLSYEDCTVPLPYSVIREHRSTQDPSSGATSQAHRLTSPKSSGPSSERPTVFSKNQTASVLSRYHAGHISITLIAQKALLNLYSPRTAAKSWEHIQEKISEMLAELEEWTQIVSIKNVMAKPGIDSMLLDREQFLLQTDYWSTKMLITRPCLCHIEGRIRNESNESQNFNAKVAQQCVEAALKMADLFPATPDMQFIYANGPWWALVHFIMQAIAVMLLEVAYTGDERRYESQPVLKSIKRLISWLRAMQKNDPVAANAYKIIWRILKSCAPPLQEDTAYLLSDEPIQAEEAGSTGTRSYTRDEQNPDFWPQESYPSTIDPDLLQQEQQVPSQITENPYSADWEPLPGPGHVPPALFGNPFYTNFDQGAPPMNLGDLWTNNLMDADYENMNFTFRRDMPGPYNMDNEFDEYDWPN